MAETERESERVGWREMIALPELVGSRIPAKIDTGARKADVYSQQRRRQD